MTYSTVTNLRRGRGDTVFFTRRSDSFLTGEQRTDWRRLKGNKAICSRAVIFVSIQDSISKLRVCRNYVIDKSDQDYMRK